MSGNITLNSFFSTQSVQTDFFERLSPFGSQRANDILSDIFNDFAQLFDLLGGNQFGGNQDIAPGGCVCPPVWDDCSHPSGSLKSDGNVITTPGGYKVEPIGQFEWKITGPDGKSTRIWGDPHVDEGDGGKWDFKKNSTFVLGDGTRINVTTAPWGNNGMTVTQGLEIISGNDRVTVSGIDKGKGVIGQITQDGYAHSNSFRGDVFMMGRETDDWSHQGREIIGSNNGGDSFKLGNQLPVGNPYPWRDETNPVEMIRNFDSDMYRNWNQNWRPNRFGCNPYYEDKNSQNDFRADRYDCNRHQNQLRRAFRAFAELFRVFERLTNLNDRMYAMRNRTMYA